VHCHYPESGRDLFARLRWLRSDAAARFLREEPASGARALLASEPFGTFSAVRLDHGVEAYGYRLDEPPGRRMLPDRLAALGVSGPAVGALQRAGRLEVGARTATLDEVSVERPGLAVAFVMDTRLCDGVYALAAGADLLIIESTFLEADAALAAEFGHLTAGQAAQVAAESGVRTLVLTHFSQRYQDPAEFEREARVHFGGELYVAQDLDRIPVPKHLV
jgi:ribonuclease Z